MTATKTGAGTMAAMAVPGAEDARQLGKSGMEALVDAGSVLFLGVEELTRSLVQLAQTQLDANISAAKALVDVRNLTQLGELQKAYARTAFDNAVSEISRLSEIMIRVSNETVEPLTARVQATLGRLPLSPLAT